MRIAILRKRSNAGKLPPPATTTQASDQDVLSGEPPSLPTDTDLELDRQNNEIGERIRDGDHINLFADLDNVAKPNAEYVNEKKDEQEKYEKQIGYLTYLGQDTNEALGKRDWYDKPPEKYDVYDTKTKSVEVGLKTKFHHDPLNVMKKFLGVGVKTTKEVVKKVADLVTVVTPSQMRTAQEERRSTTANKDSALHKEKKQKRHKKDKKHKKSSHKLKKDKKRKYEKSSKDEEKEAMLVRLRAERLEREQKEKDRAKALLDQIELKANPQKATPIQDQPTAPKVHCKQKYNSQFNPYLAKQNYD